MMARGDRGSISPAPARRTTNLRARGQSMLEYAVMVAAVTSALILMTDYVRKAFNAHAKALEEELNGATQNNAPTP